MEEVINEENCKRRTGYSMQELFQLTGIFGVHKNYNYQTDWIYEVVISDRRVRVSIGDTPLLTELTRIIDLDTKDIDNALMDGRNRHRKGIGLEILESQVAYAKKDFEFLTIKAHRNDSDPNVTWTGYWQWGKYGYLMKTLDLQIFQSRVKNYIKAGHLKLNYKNMHLHELLATEEGIEWWKVHGESWEGYFALGDESKSRELLAAACIRRREKYPSN